MSLHTYLASQDRALTTAPFYALIMAAMRRADDKNLAKLKLAWPDVWVELKARYDAPGGLLDGERG